MLTFFVSSPLDQFEVTKLISLDAPILGSNVTLTNLGLYSILVVLVFLGLHFLSVNSQRVIPSRWSLGFESAVQTLNLQVKEQVGSANEQYLPFLYSLFFFILIANLFGNVPYGYALTSSVIVAMGFSVMIFLGVTILAVSKHGFHFFSFFLPAGTPGALVPLLVVIELISYVARAFSLGIRLFANLVAGHTLLKVLAGMLYGIMTSGLIFGVLSILPLGIFIALVGLEIAVSFIQAYVFSVLTMSYLKDAIYLH